MRKRVRSREGGLATLTVYVSGSPPPDVYWRKDRRDVDTLTGRFRVIDGGTLQVGCGDDHQSSLRGRREGVQGGHIFLPESGRSRNLYSVGN